MSALRALSPARKTLLAASGSLVILGQVASWTSSPRQSAADASDELGTAARLAVVGRLLRNYATAASCLTDYKMTVDQLAGLPDRAREAELGAFHARTAGRLRDLCFANGGVYVKFGQHLAQLPPWLLPPQYARTLGAALLDGCPATPWADVARTLEEDLGAPPWRLFANIDRAPLASASLAQVHEALLFDGTRVAVKVVNAR